MALALLEVGARWLDPRLPLWIGKDHEAVVMTGHSERLWGLGEGKRKNATTTANVSSLGIREPVPTIPRPEGQERILVLGDSSFFGYGVGDQATLSSLIHRLDPAGIDTVNAGIPGYSTLQARMLMEDVGWDTEPTLLLIGCFWSDTKRAAYPDQDLLNSRSAGRSPLLQSSALVRLIAGRLRVGGIVSWTRFDELPGPSQRRVPVKDFALNLDSLIRDAAARGIGAALITPPEAIVIAGEAEPPHHWEPYKRAQAAIAAHHGIPHIQTTPAFVSQFNQVVTTSSKPTELAKLDARRQLFLDDLHPSAFGQEIMANASMAALHKAGWPETRLLGMEQGALDLSAIIDDDVRGEQGASHQVPMQNLFPHSASSGKGSQPEPVPEGGGNQKKGGGNQKKGGAVHAWVVEGQATVGANSTCRIQLIDPQGNKVSVATLLKTGRFKLQVPATIEWVDVVMTGESCAGRGRASQEDGGRVQITE